MDVILGPILHPLNFFLFDLKIYYTLFTLLHLYIQLEYTKKLFKLFKISYNKNLLSIILIFSLPNIFFGLSADWISCFFSYCLLPVVFYYLVKIIEYQNFNSYIKFSPVLSLVELTFSFNIKLPTDIFSFSG